MSISQSASIDVPRQQLFPGRSGSFDATLDPSNDVLLTILRDVGAACTVPCLGDAAQLALGLLNSVQTMRGNRDAWAKLADEAAKLVVALAKELKYETVEAPLLGVQMSSYLEELHGVLKEIDGYTKKKNSQTLSERAILSRGDEQKVKEWSEKLNHSMGVLGVHGAFLADIGVRQDTLLQGQQDLLSRQGSIIGSQQEVLQILRRLASLQEVPSSAVPVVQLSPLKFPSLPNSSSLRQGPADGPATAPSVVAEAPHGLPWHLTGHESIRPSTPSVNMISGDQIETTTHNEVHINDSFNYSTRSHSRRTGNQHNNSSRSSPRKVDPYGAGVRRGRRISACYRSKLREPDLDPKGTPLN